MGASSRPITSFGRPQARAFKEQQEYILPVRLDDSEIPAMNLTTGCIDLREHTIEQLRDVVLQKIYGDDVDPDEVPELTWKGEVGLMRPC
jgi:hypothetical protein